MDTARDHYHKRFGGTEEDFQHVVAEARQEIITELCSPAFRQAARQTAKGFADAIFPVQKLTSAALRAKRLGWMQG
jgi:hypothetical protein